MRVSIRGYLCIYSRFAPSRGSVTGCRGFPCRKHKTKVSTAGRREGTEGRGSQTHFQGNGLPKQRTRGGLIWQGGSVHITCRRVIPEHAQVKIIIEKEKSHWARWHLPLTPALRAQREVGHLSEATNEFQTARSYVERPCLRNRKRKKSLKPYM